MNIQDDKKLKTFNAFPVSSHTDSWISEKSGKCESCTFYYGSYNADNLSELSKSVNLNGQEIKLFDFARDRIQEDMKITFDMIYSGYAIMENVTIGDRFTSSEDNSYKRRDYQMLMVCDYEGAAESFLSWSDKGIAEEVFSKFNDGNRPNHEIGYYGHSLSVGDVVLIKKNGDITAYEVERYGFKALDDFYTEKAKSPKAVEFVKE